MIGSCYDLHGPMMGCVGDCVREYDEPTCETCGEAIDGEPGFSNDDHDFCDLVGPDGLTCADGARATLAEDLANHDRRVRNAFAFEDSRGAVRA